MKPSLMLVFAPLMPLLSSALLGLPGWEAPLDTPGKSFDVAIYATSEASARLYVRFDNPAQQSVSVTLLNERDEPMFRTRTRQPKYNLRLDLSELANGSYSVRVTDRNQTVVRTLRLGTVTERPRRVVSLEEPAPVRAAAR